MKFIYSNVGDIFTNLVYFLLICYFGSSIDSLRQNKNDLETVLPIDPNGDYYKTAYPYDKINEKDEIYQNFSVNIATWRIYLYKDVMISVRNIFHLIAKIPNFNSEIIDTLYFYLLPIPIFFILSSGTNIQLIISCVMFLILIYACVGNTFNKKLHEWPVVYLFPFVSLFFMGIVQDYKNNTPIITWLLKICWGLMLSMYGWYKMFENLACLFGITCYSVMYCLFVLVFSPFLIDGSYMNMLKSLYKHKVSLTFVFILLTLRSSIANLNSIKNPYKNQIVAAEIVCGIFMLYLFNKKINSN